MASGPDHLFVYGTLRRSAGHPMHAALHAAATLVGPARVRGVLYRIGWYPGVVLDTSAGWVHGEVHALRDHAVLATLDAYEGLGPDDPPPHEYRRVPATARLTTGEPRRVWVYEYAWSVEHRERIASGDFLAPSS